MLIIQIAMGIVLGHLLIKYPKKIFICLASVFAVLAVVALASVGVLGLISYIDTMTDKAIYEIKVFVALIFCAGIFSFVFDKLRENIQDAVKTLGFGIVFAGIAFVLGSSVADIYYENMGSWRWVSVFVAAAGALIFMGLSILFIWMSWAFFIIKTHDFDNEKFK